MALATDCNPGTSPLTSLLLTMNMAATLFGMTVDECIAGVTREAARALGLQREIGTLEVGKFATLQSGTLSGRLSLSTVWASTRCMPAFGEDNERDRSQSR
jgi:cytosine/adenosine deaminase-related metal-dependent hydrolase